ncbi:MAG: ribonuclease J [Firmicutes bacterium]|nr:ribonuclease J [Bacillota bacterium]
MGNKKEPVSLIPLGGVGEIGKNMWVLEYEDDIIVIDAGVMFPEEEMLGIDLVIPDITYLVENKDRVRGIFLSHGHEDHIGAVPYVLQVLNAPIYGTRLTLGLLKGKLEEHGLASTADLREVRAGGSVKVGALEVEFIHVNHSIADVVAMAVHTPQGVIVYCSDFKLDQTPIGGRVMDLHRFAELGRDGVLLLMSDSTNAERPGYTLSERVVGQAFDQVFDEAPGRILVATFSSNIHRIQQIIDAAAKHGRKVGIVGRSMINNVSIASELGYLNVPPRIMVDIDELDKYPADKVVIITTGSQGEPMAALTRMAMAEHRKVDIMPGDTVVISAMPIPGNEKLVGKTINHLFRQGARVIYQAVSGIHVSGHASQEELKLLLNLCRPRYFMPIHGEYRMLVRHAELAEMVGIPSKNILLCDIGDVVEIRSEGIAKTGKVTAGQVLVDGLGVGDVGNIVLRDRKQLAQDGILIVVTTIDKQSGTVVAGPDIISRGFVYMRESEKLIEEAREEVKQILKQCEAEGITEWNLIKGNVKDGLTQMLYQRTKRRPMIMPIIMEV